MLPHSPTLPQQWQTPLAPPPPPPPPPAAAAAAQEQQQQRRPMLCEEEGPSRKSSGKRHAAEGGAAPAAAAATLGSADAGAGAGVGATVEAAAGVAWSEGLLPWCCCCADGGGRNSADAVLEGDAPASGTGIGGCRRRVHETPRMRNGSLRRTWRQRGGRGRCFYFTQVCVTVTL